MFEKFYKKEKLNLEETINNFNEKLVTEENEILKNQLELLKELNSGGKLIRGILIKLGYSLLNKENIDYANDLALAYELFQTSVLIHDDIIDNDNIRREKETVHYSNYKKYSNYLKNEVEVKHLSNSIGICVGDYGYYLSNKIISDSYKENKNLGNVLSYYNDIVLKTIKGEMIDVILPFENKMKLINENDIEKNVMDIYKLKTAYYTIIGPLCLGLLLANSDQNKIEDISKFGEKIGIAFQIQDDILGIYSDLTGKVIGSDIKEFKQTILYAYAIKNEKVKNELLKYYGVDKLTDENITKVRKIFEECGSKKYATDLMNSLYDEALDILKKIDWIQNSDKEILKEFVEFLRERNK